MRVLETSGGIGWPNGSSRKLRADSTNKTATTKHLNELRAKDGLPARKVTYKMVGAHQIMVKPDGATVSDIKIDRGFVMNLGRTPQSAAIVRAVIGLGHGLHVSIVAEGVETQEQLSFLAEEGCDVVQGYFIGKPGQIMQYCALVGRAEGIQPAVRRTG